MVFKRKKAVEKIKEEEVKEEEIKDLDKIKTLEEEPKVSKEDLAEWKRKRELDLKLQEPFNDPEGYAKKVQKQLAKSLKVKDEDGE